MAGWIGSMKNYLEFERIETHKLHVERLLKDNKVSDLERMFSKRLTFGTAGIRGPMGPGYDKMNDLVIIQTSQGLCSYLIECHGEAKCRERGVIIGHDARHNSSRFARLSALAFIRKQFKVYFCEKIVPTPLVAFGVTQFSCVCGIVITASHNPKQDNGYKVYWSNGAQILDPHDKYIQSHIMMPINQKPWPRAWQHELVDNVGDVLNGNQMLCRVYDLLTETYYAFASSLCKQNKKFQHNQMSSIKIVYTAMHGVGHVFLKRILEDAGFMSIQPVEAQSEPDPEFPTVRFPNPEETGALDLAFKTAAQFGSNLIIANDPDADRCAAALYNKETGEKRVLTGNEIGQLLGWWAWHCYTTNKEDCSVDALKCYMISTTVSTKFLQSMARVEGFQFAETLTGFKHMGNLAEMLINQGNLVLFAFEEAIGYMCSARILDKDGLTAALQLAHCAAYLASRDATLATHLDWLYNRYGYHYSYNSYYLCHDPQIICKIFCDLQADYPTSFILKSSDEMDAKIKLRVTRIRDLNNNFDNSTQDKRATLPSSSSSYMVTFFIDDNITITLRTSGTEPKIKFYSEIIVLPEQLNVTDRAKDVRADARYTLQQLVHAVVERCLQPSKYNLISSSV